LATILLSGQATGPVAVINGEEVKSSDYYHRVEHLNGVYTQYSERLLEVPPGLIALDRIITEHLTLQLAALHGIAPKQAEIDEAYSERLKSNPMMEKDAAGLGITTDDLKYQITVDLARFKLVTEGINVTDQEIQTEYTINKVDYTTPKLVTIRYIVVGGDADKSAVDADLAGGAEFEKVATNRSIDVSKINGGLQKDVPFDSFDKSIQAALSSIKIGQTTGWISVPKQAPGSPLLEKLMFISATEPKLLPLDDNLRESIRRKLMLKRGSVKNDVTAEMNDMISKAKVDIKDPVFAKAWSDLRQRALSNQKDPSKAGG
jgi:foldase protein PrsA